MSSNNNNNSNGNRILHFITPSEVTLEVKDPVDPTALEQARAILQDLRPSGTGHVLEAQLIQVAQRLGDLAQSDTTTTTTTTTTSSSSTQWIATKEECQAAFDGLTAQERSALVNIHARVAAFAKAQRSSVQDMEMDIPGGKAGHTVSPCQGTYVCLSLCVCGLMRRKMVDSHILFHTHSIVHYTLYPLSSPFPSPTPFVVRAPAAGCYAPGGRYPLPSSVVMTAVTARAAGCERVVLASPRPALITLAAAHVCGVDMMLKLGGAQAIAAMAYGVVDSTGVVLVPRCDVICGPGNKWVTAAKALVNGYCGIDMLAGPSEVLVICDDTCRADVVAADLIAQAEHDVVARAILLSTSAQIIDQVEEQVARQVEALPEPNRSTALQALKQSFAVHCQSIEQCIQLADEIAPEHLEIQTRDAMKVGQACKNYGGLFVGEHAAEVLGDYGAGPNHTLPTGGTGRYTGGLSVFNFLRIRTWMRVDDAKASQSMVNDSIVMARLEGLEGHARAAETRLK